MGLTECCLNPCACGSTACDEYVVGEQIELRIHVRLPARPQLVHLTITNAPVEPVSEPEPEPPTKAEWYDVMRSRWRSLGPFQQVAMWELHSQGQHHGNEPTREALRELGLMDGEKLSAEGIELITWAQAAGVRPTGARPG